MDDNFDTCLAFTLKEEGGYSDNPADPGGATNMGITLATYRQWADNPKLRAGAGAGYDGANGERDLSVFVLEPVASGCAAGRRRSQRV
jgi:hypothetical protein